MNIYDRFSSIERAKAFAQKADGKCYMSQDESDAIDPFPYELTPPIVLTPRRTPSEESAERRLVKQFGGSYAGT